MILYIKLYQCTGFKDENRTLIYEGDIVQILGDEIPYVIEFEQDRAMFVIHSEIHRVCFYFDNFSGDDLYVIGNIYENPELLEGKMTSELEQKFYDTLGIEPEYYCTYEKIAKNKLEYECTDNNLEKCKECKYVGIKYPEITAEKLLQMICILNSTNGINCTAYASKNISDLKKEILNECMDLANDNQLKSGIQQLFKD